MLAGGLDGGEMGVREEVLDGLEAFRGQRRAFTLRELVYIVAWEQAARRPSETKTHVAKLHRWVGIHEGEKGNRRSSVSIVGLGKK